MSKVRVITKQRAVRFDVEDILEVSVQDARRDLVGSSVVDASSVQYNSRLRTLGRFLVKLRKLPPSGSRVVTARDLAASCTEGEYLQFLFNWKRQQKGPANAFRAALLREHRMAGVCPSFLDRMDVKKATAGAGSNAVKSDKGVLDEEMNVQFQDFCLHGDAEDLGIMCQSCKGVEPGVMRRLMVCAHTVMINATVRPGNLKDMRSADLLKYGGRYVVNVLHPKVAGENRVWGNEAVAQAFREAKSVYGNQYLFPRCIAKHLSVALRVAEELFDWVEGLVFAPHCLRHTCMSRKVQAFMNAERTMELGVTVATSHVYDRDNAMRLLGRREAENME